MNFRLPTVAFLALMALLSVSGACAESILLPPAYPELYQKDPADLTQREVWRVRIFGLRNAPLDPEIWGLRRIDRTENRHVVPMRPFFLRASEDPNFRLQEISLEFQFKPVKESEFEKLYHQRDAVLDIGLANEFVEGGEGASKQIDKGYVVRLSAFPALASGVFTRADTKLSPVVPLTPSKLETGRKYTLNLRVESSSLRIVLDGVPAGELADSTLDRGLVSITTGWNPVRIGNLRIVGTRKTPTGAGKLVTQSGLVDISGAKSKRPA